MEDSALHSVLMFIYFIIIYENYLYFIYCDKSYQGGLKDSPSGEAS